MLPRVLAQYMQAHLSLLDHMICLCMYGAIHRCVEAQLLTARCLMTGSRVADIFIVDDIALTFTGLIANTLVYLR